MTPSEFQRCAIVAPSEQHWGLHGFAVSNGCSEKQLSDCDFRLRDKKGVQSPQGPVVKQYQEQTRRHRGNVHRIAVILLQNIADKQCENDQ